MGFQMPNFGDGGIPDDDDDDDLEAELQRLQQDYGGDSRSKANKGKSGLLILMKIIRNVVFICVQVEEHMIFVHFIMM